MNISSEGWQAIEGQYDCPIPAEVRREIEDATDALIERTRAGLTTVSMKPAIERAARLRKLAGDFYEEWTKARSFDPGAEGFYADQTICFNLLDPFTGDPDIVQHYHENMRPESMHWLLAPFFKGLPEFLRACDAAEVELEQMNEACPGSRKGWDKGVWDEWLISVSEIMKRHRLPSGPGVTETKDEVRYSRFGHLMRALQIHAFPPDIPRRSMTGEAMEGAIKRARRKRKAETGIK